MTMEIPALERPLFFEGQRLTPADLAVIQAFDRELRWLHNRSLHGWGVVRGYAATGERNARSVNIMPGYALDCLGRELVLERPLDVAVPAVAPETTYYLTVSYADDADLTPETRAGACGTSGAVRLPNDPVIRFQDANATGNAARRPGLDVVLATATVAGCLLALPLSTAQREDLKGDQPYVAAGRTPAGETDWRLWPSEDYVLGFATTVETSAAGFLSTPVYQACVLGERMDDKGFVVDGYAHLESPGATAFDLCVVLPTGYTTAASAYVPLNPADVFDIGYLGTLRFDLRWHVAWMGVEA
jgi:hypothetical protein